MYRVDESKCAGCGSCVAVCPSESISLLNASRSLCTPFRLLRAGLAK